MPTLRQFDQFQYTLVCGASDINPYERVTIDASGLAIVQAVAAGDFIGFADEGGGRAGDPMTIRSVQAPSFTCVASGAIAVGDDVTGDTAGQVQSGGAGVFVGKAQTLAAQAGDILHVIAGWQ